MPLGVLLALAGTMMHQVRANDAAQTPVGLIVALIMTASLAIALRLLRRSRGALYLITFTLAATVIWLAQRQPGGELFIPGNDAGSIWAFGSIGICSLVILFPKIQPGAWRRSSRGHR
jgi:N-acetyl-1-D-myo-inositol-2-amino-2-deoxy-alpha-D-glucopyranoside deacetylase